jgi:hypothetical protein
LYRQDLLACRLFGWLSLFVFTKPGTDNAIHGIHAASRALRHADIRVTNEYYTDSRARVTPGMGHLLKEDKPGDGDEPDDKITEMNQPARPTKRKRGT